MPLANFSVSRFLGISSDGLATKPTGLLSSPSGSQKTSLGYGLLTSGFGTTFFSKTSVPKLAVLFLEDSESFVVD
jgi:hypothetical protein